MPRPGVALATALAVCLSVRVAAAQPAPQILPQPPNSDERRVPIEALRRQGPALAQAFAPHVYANAKGERMPYRLFTPPRLEPGRTVSARGVPPWGGRRRHGQR